MDHLDLDDTTFLAQFEKCSLDPVCFDHEAHLRLAWLMINKHGLAKAIDIISLQLFNYVNHLSAAEKFNRTLTVAAIQAVNHFIKKTNQVTFRGFIAEFPQLKNSFKTLISTHYTIDIFNLPAAKQTYIEPDLLPFA